MSSLELPHRVSRDALLGPKPRSSHRVSQDTSGAAKPGSAHRVSRDAFDGLGTQGTNQAPERPGSPQRPLPTDVFHGKVETHRGFSHRVSRDALSGKSRHTIGKVKTHAPRKPAPGLSFRALQLLLSVTFSGTPMMQLLLPLNPADLRISLGGGRREAERGFTQAPEGRKKSLPLFRKRNKP